MKLFRIGLVSVFIITDLSFGASPEFLVNESKIYFGNPVGDAVKALIDLGECSIGSLFVTPVIIAGYQSYRKKLKAEGEEFEIPVCLKEVITQRYGLNPDWIHVRVNVRNTPEETAITLENVIYFPRTIDPLHNQNDLHWLLHELEHVVQWKLKGVGGFLAEYICHGAMNLDEFDPAAIHDSIDIEMAADAKADALSEQTFSTCRSKS